MPVYKGEVEGWKGEREDVIKSLDGSWGGEGAGFERFDLVSSTYVPRAELATYWCTYE